MDRKKVEEKARERFGENGLYCAESVLSSIAEEAGIESPLIPRIASGFCGGIARTRGICGAVSGGVMALGLAHGRDSGDQKTDTVYRKVQQFLRAFEREFGSTNCLDLTGCDLGTDQGREEFAARGMAEKCREFTGRAAALATAVIDDGTEES